MDLMKRISKVEWVSITLCHSTHASLAKRYPNIISGQVANAGGAHALRGFRLKEHHKSI